MDFSAIIISCDKDEYEKKLRDNLDIYRGERLKSFIIRFWLTKNRKGCIVPVVFRINNNYILR